MAAFSPPRLLAFLPPGVSRRPFFRGFPLRWVLHFVLSLTRSIIVHDAAPGKILFMNVGAHAMHYLVFSFLFCGFGATNP